MDIRDELYRVTIAMGQTLDLSRETGLFLDAVARCPHVRAVALFLADEAEEQMALVGGRGMPEEAALTAQGLASVLPMGADPLAWLSQAVGTAREDPGLYAIPLVMEGRLLGVLAVWSTAQDAELEAEQDFCLTLSNYAAPIIRNIQRYQGLEQKVARRTRELQRRTEELALIYETGRVITSSLDWEQVLYILLQKTTEILDADAASILLRDQNTGETVIVAAAGAAAEEVKNMRLPPGQGIAGWVIEHGQPLLVPDVRQDPRFYRDVDAHTGFTTRSILCVPLAIEDRVIGAIEAINKRGGQFTADDQRLLSTLAQQASVAIENARLFRQLSNLQEFNQRIIQAIGQGLVVLDSQAHIVFFNEFIRREYGWDDSFLGQNLFQVRPIYAELGLQEHFQQIMESGEPMENMIVTHPDPRQPTRTLTRVFHGYPLHENGRISGVVVLIEDITARVEAEERERRQEARLTIVNEIGRQAATTLDLDQLLEKTATAIKERLGYFDVLIVLVEDNYIVVRAWAAAYPIEAWVRRPISPDKGIIDYVVRTGESLLVPDVSREPRYVQVYPEVRSELCVPIRWGEEVIGAINIESDRLNAFDEGDRIALETLADQLATAIANARLFRETQRKLRQQTILFQASAALSSTLDLDKLLRILAEGMAKAIDARDCAISLWDRDNDALIVLAEYAAEDWETEEGQVYPLSEYPASRRVLQTQEPLIVYIDDPHADPQERALLAEYEFTGLLALPLVSKYEVIGLVELYDDRHRRFTEEDVELSRALASHAAAAIENARLFADVERARQEWESTFQAITDGVSIHDAQFHILRVNQALAERLGTTPENLVGKVCYELFHHSEAPLDCCPHAQVIRTGQPAEAEIEDPILGGIFRIACYPIRGEQGEIIGSVHVLQDITERKQLQERLLQTQKLSALGELISGVAHELNNPLTAVVGYAQLLEEERIPPDMRADLRRIREQAQRAARIVQNLLDFARKRPPEKVYTDLNSLLERTLDLRAYELRVNNIKVVTDLASGLPWTMVDPHQIQQVFLNIITNAQQAMSEAHGRGTLTVRTSVQDDVIRVEIADDGPGIPPEIMPRIFDPFFTTKEVGKGTGLGLSIAYGIVTEHGGQIWAESQPGQGARFIIELPVVRAEWAVLDERDKETPAPEVKECRTLVVDDEESIASLLARILRGAGHVVDVTTDGKTALQLLEKKCYDLVITDVKMPGVSGQRIYRWIQEHRPELARRVLFTTGDVVAPDTQEFLLETGNAYISKPFNISRVLEVVEAVLEE